MLSTSLLLGAFAFCALSHAALVQYIPDIDFASYEIPKLQVGLTDSEKRFLTATHSLYRKVVAKGAFQSMPSAANMLEMVWSESLAAEAQVWASNCTGGPHGHHDGHGQNFAMSGSPKGIFKVAFLKWCDEEYDVWIAKKNPLNFTDYWPESAHFSQVIWGRTEEVGCGYRNCGDFVRLVCNYSPSGNSKGAAPYTIGEPCAACPSNRALCVNNTVCGKTGNKTRDDCKDGSTYCKEYKLWFCAAAEILPEYSKLCPLTCGKC